MKFLFAFLAIFSGCANSTVGEINMATDDGFIQFTGCKLIWNSQARDDGAPGQWTFIDTQCPGATPPPSMYVGGATTLYINGISYTCPLGDFVFTSVPQNQFVLFMKCEVGESQGFEKPSEG